MKIADILQELARTGSMRPLDAERYAACLATYESASTQRARIADWFTEAVAPGLPKSLARVLSVGCGAGDLDLVLLGSAAGYSTSLCYVGIEPAPSQCRRFVSRLRGADHAGVEIEGHDLCFEAFEDPRRFDLVLMVHSLYYMEHPQQACERALRLVEKKGRLAVLVASNDRLNELSSAFWELTNGRPSWFSEDLQAYLEAAGASYERTRIEATLDVTDCCEPRSARGVEIADFLAQISTADLPARLREMVFAYLEESADHDGSRRWLPHNVDALMIEGA